MAQNNSCNYCSVGGKVIDDSENIVPVQPQGDISFRPIMPNPLTIPLSGADFLATHERVLTKALQAHQAVMDMASRAWAAKGSL